MNDSRMMLTKVRWSGFLLYPLHGDVARMSLSSFRFIGIPNLSFLNSFGKVGGNIHGGGGGTGPDTSCRRFQIALVSSRVGGLLQDLQGERQHWAHRRAAPQIGGLSNG